MGETDITLEDGRCTYRSGMDKVAVLVLIAVAAFVSSFVLTSVFAFRPLRRRWLPTSAGVPLADFAEKSFDRLEGQPDRLGQTLARAEWSSRLLQRELLQRELRKPR